MPQLLVIALSNTGAIKDAIEQQIAPADHTEVLPNVWLVSFPGSASELSEKLGTKDGSKGNLLISAMTDISGFAPHNLIRWIDQHAEH